MQGRPLRRLRRGQVEQFREEGCLVGLTGIPPEQAARCCERFDAIDPARLEALDCPWRAQTHLLFTWVDEIIRHRVILETVADLLGPDLLVEGASLFVKEPRSEAYISFHQDSFYWDIEPHEIVTAWIALSEATRDNGCMQYAARSHRQGMRPHEATYAPHNALTRGQVVQLDDDDRIVDVVLQPGQIAIHHCLLAHASGPNPTDRRRIGIGIRYFPTHVRQISGPPMRVVLVSGEDRHRHFAPAPPPPRADLDEAAIAAHRECMAPHAVADFATT